MYIWKIVVFFAFAISKNADLYLQSVNLLSRGNFAILMSVNAILPAYDTTQEKHNATPHSNKGCWDLLPEDCMG